MRAALFAVCLSVAACAPEPDVLTFSGSAVGREAEILRTQLARFSAERGIDVRIRPTPDSADQRHQLYVQWLNARSAEPDVLQLDVIWTPEFAAAGWLAPLDRFAPDVSDFFPATIEANRWRGRLFALPWFVDVGMLYWRTDLFEGPPATLEALHHGARQAIEHGAVRHGIVWQGARYEGLITVFVEYLGAFGGSILDPQGAVVVHSDGAVRALTAMRDAIGREGLVPRAALTWQEEQTRFAFQNGSAAAMRNWPYATALLSSPDSAVAGRFAVTAMPAAPGGARTAALGGSQLAINGHSAQMDDAWALISYLTAPAQMLERAQQIGQFPSRESLFDGGHPIGDTIGVAPSVAREIIRAARPRPVTPVYTQLSEILQIQLHRALSGQIEPRAALETAAHAMRELLERSGLDTAGGQ